MKHIVEFIKPTKGKILFIVYLILAFLISFWFALTESTPGPTYDFLMFLLLPANFFMDLTLKFMSDDTQLYLVINLILFVLFYYLVGCGIVTLINFIKNNSQK